jgi:hypothetical protein
MPNPSGTLSLACCAVNRNKGRSTLDGRGVEVQPLFITQAPDLVAPKLGALLDYRLSLRTPEPPRNSFDRAAATRGRACAILPRWECARSPRRGRSLQSTVQVESDSTTESRPRRIPEVTLTRRPTGIVDRHAFIGAVSIRHRRRCFRSLCNAVELTRHEVMRARTMSTRCVQGRLTC